ncbi:response regulator [Paenibacillus silvisoli]|uniref:response regulator n=1 Tax=Paenibacillus silvisoli TaxID=3110539 RepID=UPI0028045B66|nr:response regulator [Paenibacillus silvisoli]
MIFVLILLTVCLIMTVMLIKRRQHENNKPIIAAYHRSPLNQSDQPTGQGLAPSAFARTNPDAPSFSIMIVDDQQAIRMLLRELFEQEGMTVYEACNGASAIETAREKQLDFILLDLKMPDMDGIAALRGIRKANGAVQVAMITAFGDPGTIETAKQLGVQSFFTKPFDIEQVKNSVMNHLLHPAGKEDPQE